MEIDPIIISYDVPQISLGPNIRMKQIIIEIQNEFLFDDVFNDTKVLYCDVVTVIFYFHSPELIWNIKENRNDVISDQVTKNGLVIKRYSKGKKYNLYHTYFRFLSILSK